MSERQPWEPCPAGQLGAMVEGIRAARRRRWMGRLGTATTLLVLLVIGYTATQGMLSDDLPHLPGKLNCQQAMGYFSDLHDGTLNASTREQVEVHLRNCPQCREHYRQMYPREAREVADPCTGLLARR